MTGTASSNGVKAGGPASAIRPGPIAPPDSPTRMPSRNPPTPPAPAPSATRATRPSRAPSSTRQPENMPPSRGARPSTKTQPGNSPGGGKAASSGKPGTLPSCEPVRSTDVSVPSMKPGPTSADAVHSISVGAASTQAAASAKPPPVPGIELGPDVASTRHVAHELHDHDRTGGGEHDQHAGDRRPGGKPEVFRSGEPQAFALAVTAHGAPRSSEAAHDERADGGANDRGVHIARGRCGGRDPGDDAVGAGGGRHERRQLVDRVRDDPRGRTGDEGDAHERGADRDEPERHRSCVDARPERHEPGAHRRAYECGERRVGRTLRHQHEHGRHREGENRRQQRGEKGRSEVGSLDRRRHQFILPVKLRRCTQARRTSGGGWR